MPIPLYLKSRIMNLSDLLPVLREGISAGYAGAQVVYVDGKPVKRDPTTFWVRCNVQPLTGGLDLQLVPEGDRYTQSYVFYQQLDDPNEVEQLQCNDKVLYQGDVYHLQAVENWGPYNKARGILRDVGPDVHALFPTDPHQAPPEPIL